MWSLWLGGKNDISKGNASEVLGAQYQLI